MESSPVRNVPCSSPSVATFALVACQRTGSHLLRELINSNPSVAVLSEAFSCHPRPVYWQNFVRTLPPETYPPTSLQDAFTLLDQYMQAIQLDVQENSDWYGGPKPDLKYIGLDVKYNQLKCVAPLFLNLCKGPALLEYFRLRQTPIVHLVRKNLVHTAISAIIANIRKVWQNYDGTVIQAKYQIAPGQLRNYVRWVREEREQFSQLAADLPVHICVFEDLKDDLELVDASGAFPDDTKALAPLAAFLNIPNQFRFHGNIQKVINKPYAEVIKNYDEVLTVLEHPELSEFASSL